MDALADGAQIADSGPARDSSGAPVDAGSANDAPLGNLDGSPVVSLDGASDAGVDRGAETVVSAPDSGVPADASNLVTSGDAATPAPSGKIGVIALMQTVQTLPAPLGTIIASGAVAQFGFSAGTNACTSTTTGDCQLFTCTTGSSNPQTGLVQAGTVTITGLSSPLALPYMPAQSGYMSSAYGNYLWTTSTPATLTVTGSADVPAFTMSLGAPNPIVVTSPVAQIGATGSTYTLSRSSDLAVVWTGGVDGSVTVSLSSDESASSPVSISCTVSATAGRVTVPATFLSKIGSSGSFTAGVNNYTTKNVDDWFIQFQASDLRAQGTATFTD